MLTADDFMKPCVRCQEGRAEMALVWDVGDMSAPAWPVCFRCSRLPARETALQMLAALVVALVIVRLGFSFFAGDGWRQHVTPSHAMSYARESLPDRLLPEPSGFVDIPGEPHGSPPQPDMDEFTLTHALNDG